MGQAITACPYLFALVIALVLWQLWNKLIEEDKHLLLLQKYQVCLIYESF